MHRYHSANIGKFICILEKEKEIETSSECAVLRDTNGQQRLYEHLASVQRGENSWGGKEEQ